MKGQILPAMRFFRLSTVARQELLLLVLHAPYMVTDLRAAPSSRLFTTDASPFAAGVCEAQVSPGCTLEVLRHADYKGHHTHLEPQLSRYLEEHGYCSEASRSVPAALAEKAIFDLCAAFRGDGNLSAAAREQGWTVHPGFDILDGPGGDVLASAPFLQVVGLICRRVVRYVHVAPVCKTFGTMYRPRCRSKFHPWGIGSSDPEAVLGNRLAVRAAFVLHLCASFRVLATCEQPSGSVMYRLDISQRLYQRGFFSVKFPFCNYGTPYMKLSHWLVNNPTLAVLQDICRCPYRGQHLRLEGQFKRRT